MNRREIPLRLALTAAVLLAWCAALNAGPIATIEQTDGTSVEAEVVGFSNGIFFIRDVKTDQFSDLRAAEVRSIDFGETARDGRVGAPAQRALTTEQARALATQHRFPLLLAALQWTLNTGGKEPVQAVERDLAADVAGTNLQPETRRDTLLAHALALLVLGEKDQAERAVGTARRLRPNDPIVMRFNREMKALAEPVLQRRKGPPTSVTTTSSTLRPGSP